MPNYQIKTYASVDRELTEAEVAEYVKCATDCQYFIENYVKVQHPTLGSVLFNLYDYQERTLEGLLDHDKTIILQPRQSGKALDLNTKIPTPTGWTTMGDIKIGDIIYDDQGKPTNVISSTDTMYDHNCYQIVFDNGEIVNADEEHLWKVWNSDWHTKHIKHSKILTTKEVLDKFTVLQNRSSNSSGLYIELQESLDCKKIELPIEPYTLGVWLGDGTSRSARITTHIDDCNDIHKSIINEDYDLHPTRMVKDKPNVTNTTIKKLHIQLRENNLFLNKHIPSIYLRSSKKQRIALLRGLMDTDGSCDKGGSCEFYQKDEILIDQVRELLSSLGIKSTKRYRIIDNQKYYTISFTTRKFYVFNLKRKRERQKLCKNHPKNKRIYFNSIKQIDSVPVKCIQVDNEEHLFLFGETMIPTHNSATIVAYVLWETIFHEDIQVGFASYIGNASKDLIVRFKYAYENLPDFLKPIVTSYNVHDIAFDNKSSVISQTTTENTFRGKSLSIIFLDELAFVKPKVARAFWKSLLPSLTAGAGLKKGRDLKLIITSTPNGSENKFAELWFKAEQGDSDFHAVRVYNEEVLGRDDAFKENMLQTMSQDEYDQEYGCMFISTSGTLIHSRFLEELRYKKPIKTYKSIDIYNRIKGRRLAITADVGTGVGSDYSVVQIFDMDTLEQVGEYRNNQLTTSQFAKQIIKILEYVDKEGAIEIYYSVEANSIGQGVINLLNIATSPVLKKAELVVERKLRKHGGMLTTTKSKMKGCMKFKDLIEKKHMTIHSRSLLSELKFFVKAGASFKAETGMTDDLVMGCVVLTNMLNEIAAYDETVYDTMNSVKEFDLEGESEDDPMPFIM